MNPDFGIDYLSLMYPSLVGKGVGVDLLDIFKNISENMKVACSNNLECSIVLRDQKVSTLYPKNEFESELSNSYIWNQKPDKQKIVKLTPEQYCQITINFLYELIKFTEQGIDVFNDMVKLELEENIKGTLKKFNIGD